MDIHPNHHQQQHHHPAPPPPPPPHKPLVENNDLKRRAVVPLSFSNGALKKHRPLYLPLPPPPNHVVYRECMKNHAASLGGHALDGCGEFMSSPDATPTDPASLTCAACGCHRNFHRRMLHGGGDHPLPLREERELVDDGAAEEDDDDDEARVSTPPPQAGAAAHQYYSAPHMLMALSAGIPGGPSGSAPPAAGSASGGTHVAGGSNPASATGGLPRKRFRTKFSNFQKERMQELSERLGWRMQRRDEALVEECCREIGVTRGVFKVWMHNNKHNYVSGPSSRRSGSGFVVGGAAGAVGGNGGCGGGGGEATSSSGGAIGGGGGVAPGVNGVEERNGVGKEQNGSGGDDVHGLNGSSPSS